jgi:hypothetical protein
VEDLKDGDLGYRRFARYKHREGADKSGEVDVGSEREVGSLQIQR